MHLQIQVSTHNQVLTEEGRGNQVALGTSNRTGSFEPVQNTCWNLASQHRQLLAEGWSHLGWRGSSVWCPLLAGTSAEKQPRAGVQAASPRASVLFLSQRNS